MKRHLEQIEYEQLMLSRYTIAQQRQFGGVDRSVYLLMSRIQAQGPLSIAELSHGLRLDNSTLQRQVTHGIDDGYLERIADPDGHIARKITLTDLGLAKLEHAREVTLHALDRILNEWEAEDVEQFAGYLQRFNASIEEYRNSQRD